MRSLNFSRGMYVCGLQRQKCFEDSLFSCSDCCVSRINRHLSAVASSRVVLAPMAMPRVRIAVVGDVHDDWDSTKDRRALEVLKPDLVLFTGDFGNENIDLVHSISKLDLLKAAILGNHDCWYTIPRSSSDAVEAQLESLGNSHIGYSRMDISELKLSVIGARPFSWGGNEFDRTYELLKERYGVKGLNESANKISSLALNAPTDHVLVFLGHNGPAGLGSEPSDICGKDWSRTYTGDYGDPDLEMALKNVKQKGLHNVQLVIFGHMHKQLHLNRGDRTMLVRGPDNIIYVNAAVVPRVLNVSSKSNNTGITESETIRNFTIIDVMNNQVTRVAETWIRVGENDFVDSETILYSCMPQ